jgi:Tfp pilus assembly protein PilN
MSKNPAQFADINLLPEDPFFSTIVGRTIRWALTAGRFMIIFTELIGIVSFASRFKLDRERTDLNNSIQHKTAIIESYGDLETKFKAVQARLAYFNEVNNNKIDTDLFLYLNQIIPTGVTIDNLTISSDQVSVSGTVPSQDVFNTLIANLKQSNKLTEISIGKIEKNSEKNQFDFKFNAKIKTSKNTTKNKK